MAVPASGNPVTILGIAREKRYDSYSSDYPPHTGGINKFPTPLDGNSWAPTGIRCTLSRDTSNISHVNHVANSGGSLKMVCTSTDDPYTYTYHNASYRHTPATQSETWTFSFYAKADANRTCQVFMFSAYSNGLIIGNGAYNYPNANEAYVMEYVAITPDWQRFEMTHQVCSSTSYTSDCAYIQVRLDGPPGGDSATIWYDGFQLEEASEASDFSMNGPYSMYDLANGTGTYSSVNFEETNEDGDDYPNDTVPHQMSEWYDYDHDAEFDEEFGGGGGMV